MKKFFNEFKTFAMKGNVIDLAIGVIIGSAFSKIVSSLVNDMIMPLLGLILGKISISDLTITITSRLGSDPIIIKYGVFLQNIIDFLIIAFSIFIALKAVNRIMRKNEKEVKPPKEEVLLTEIRDLLKNK
ncbi:MAG: large-conductance mechanosensitive channel protein MscL [Eubacteriaceae bacterium]|nr:large-conductance mechanosensitive channel protein MscL [Eubacteriaceae bacterium]